MFTIKEKDVVAWTLYSEGFYIPFMHMRRACLYSIKKKGQLKIIRSSKVTHIQRHNTRQSLEFIN